MAFFGEYQVSVTAGDRIVIPKKIRQALTGSIFILTKGFDICLAGFDYDDWQSRTKQLLDVSLLDKEFIDRKRMIFSGASEVGVDDQGRFVIPQSLVKYIGGSNKELIIIGVGDHFEIWNIDKWHQYQEQYNK